MHSTSFPLLQKIHLMLHCCVVLYLPTRLMPLGNNVCHAYCNSPQIQRCEAAGNNRDRSSHSSCNSSLKSVAVLHKACGHQLGKQAETDNRSGPHSWAMLWDKADHQFSHAVIAVSVGVRVRPGEVQSWLCCDTHLMSWPGCTWPCECLRVRRKQKHTPR